MREARMSLGITIELEKLEFLHTMHRKCNEPEFFAALFKPQSWQGFFCKS